MTHNRIKSAYGLGIFSFLATVLAASPSRSQHADDILVGQSGGAVAWHPAGLQPGTEYHELLRVKNPFVGWSNNEPGFDAATTSEGGVSPLSHGQEIWLEVVQLDTALLVIGDPDVLEFPGDSTLLGGHDLHAHLTFFVEEAHPDFDADQCAWQGIFKLVEDKNLLQDSPPFSLLFSTVPFRHEDEPAVGRFDPDADVDAADHSALAECLSGPDMRPTHHAPATAACEGECHNAFDFDNDLDLDLLDFAEFQTIFGN